MIRNSIIIVMAICIVILLNKNNGETSGEVFSRVGHNIYVTAIKIFSERVDNG